ncbi:MAG: universal stress protein [Ignavibacteriae bacterium]|nr:MAG: universal stress protein [Ignavibacteriota bacterium]
MLKKILCPTDFSESSEKVKNELKKLSGCNVKEVILLHVLDERLYSYSYYIDSFSIDSLNIQGEVQKSIEKKMNAWKKELEKAGLKVKTKIIEGIPFTEIISFAKENKVTSIMMGHQGHSKVEEMLLGSTAEKVSRKAPVSVILVR